jgi:hypothetical protein
MIHILNSKKKNANESKLIKKLELIYIYIYMNYLKNMMIPLLSKSNPRDCQVPSILTDSAR